MNLYLDLTWPRIVAFDGLSETSPISRSRKISKRSSISRMLSSLQLPNWRLFPEIYTPTRPARCCLGWKIVIWCWIERAEQGINPWDRYDPLGAIHCDKSDAQFRHSQSGRCGTHSEPKWTKATRITRYYHVDGLGPSDFIHIRRYCSNAVTSHTFWFTVDRRNIYLFFFFSFFCFRRSLESRLYMWRQI